MVNSRHFHVNVNCQVVKAFLALSLRVPLCKACDKYNCTWVYMCVCVCVSESCPTPCNPMDSCLPDSSVHGILQAGILEWVAILFSRRSSWPRDCTWGSCLAGRFFTVKPPGKSYMYTCVHVSHRSPVFCPERYLKPVSLLILIPSFTSRFIFLPPFESEHHHLTDAQQLPKQVSALCKLLCLVHSQVYKLMGHR